MDWKAIVASLIVLGLVGLVFLNSVGPFSGSSSPVTSTTTHATTQTGTTNTQTTTSQHSSSSPDVAQLCAAYKAQFGVSYCPFLSFLTDMNFGGQPNYFWLILLALVGLVIFQYKKKK